MYLVYMNFVDEDRQYMPVHVLCADRDEARKIVSLGKSHGLTPTSRFAQYALFETDGKISATAMASAYIYTASEFAHRWQDVTARPLKIGRRYEYLVIDLDGHDSDDWSQELGTWAGRGFELVNVVEHGGKPRAFLRMPTD